MQRVRIREDKWNIRLEGHDDVVESVDYEAHWAIADNPDNL
jgi:hypothetical protein